MADTVVLPAANRLLACLAEQLSLNPNPPANVCLRAGDLFIQDVDGSISVDKACCPGTAYVRITDKYPASDFPNPDTTPAKRNNCMPHRFAVQLIMGVARCVPGMGTPEGPDCADWTAAATQDANDLDAMGKALCCWADGLAPGRLWIAQVSTVQLTADCLERQWPIIMEVGKCC